LLNQFGQVVAAGEAVSVAAGVLEAGATLAVAVMSGASLVAAVLARRRLSTEVVFAERRVSMAAAFTEHRLSGAHTLVAEVLAVLDLDSIMAVPACQQCGQMDSLAQSIGP
jgi:hypothetical protein